MEIIIEAESKLQVESFSWLIST